MSIPRCLLLTALLLWPAFAQQANNSTERKYPKEVFKLIQDRLQTNRRTDEGIWSEWTSWSPCSRSCGGGVSMQTRNCISLRVRRSSDNATASATLRNRRSDDPNDLNALDVSTNSSAATIGQRSGCVGLYKRYHMCNTQECPTGSPDFRQAQCESHNGKLFMGRYYIWEAYWDADNPCELNCRALTFRFYALLNKTVVDGTPCRQNDPSRVCVAGTCKAIGCDGIIGSDKRPDACGVCGGNNSTCQIVSGIYTEAQLPPGYNLVAQLPKGACYINITELKPSRNVLALRRPDGTFVFNGNWAISWSGDYEAAGTTFTYQRQDATTPELISAQGPLAEPLDIMVIYQELNSGIKYEYMLPLGVPNNLIPPRPNLPPVIPPYGQNEFGRSERFPLEPAAPVPAPALPSYPINNNNNNNRVIELGAEGGLAALAGIRNSLPTQVGAGYAGPSANSVPLSLGASGSLARLGIFPQQFEPPKQEIDLPAPVGLDTNLPTPTYAPPTLPKPDTPPRDQTQGGRPNRRRHHGHRHHANSGGSLESQGKHKSANAELQAIDANTPTLPPHRRGTRRHSNGKTFVWKQVGLSECSKTCGGGVQQQLVVCVRERDQVPVADHRCKQEDRPTSETVRCATTPCPAEWVLGEWTACSVTCGEGIQTRDLTCKQEISATLTMRVHEGACLNPAPTAPRVRNCNPGHCAKWHVSDWGKCSTNCGKGMRHRRVYCQGADGRDIGDAECSATDKPTTSDICDMGSCSVNTWFFTEWTGQCSEECGTGTQTRRAHCSGASDDDCDPAKKPETSRTCVSAKDCGGKWFAGPWSQCSAACDEGTQTREVICLTFVRGQYRVGLDMQCSARDKPSATAPCNLGKCQPQWYTSEWSECSATCGTGAQRREVKCLDSNQQPSQDCRDEDRPPLRHACNVKPCNEVVPNAEETTREAQDTPVVTTESNRSLSETTDQPVKPKKSKHSKSNKIDNSQLVPVTNSPTSSEEATPSSSTSDSSGEGCMDKFKNCHLVVQARLCKLKYYLVSCCASCSKPKT